MPVVLNVRHTNLPAGGNTRRSSGTTESVNMGRNSRGGPGSMMSQLGWPPARNGLGRNSIASPGAVPCGLCNTVAPSGIMACTFVRSGMGRLRRSKIWRMCASTAASSRNSFPSNCATKSRVRSSEVGPSPPVAITRSARASASRTARSMSLPASGTATCRVTT